MYRAMHQAPPVTWNKEIAAKAQDWADKLAKEQRLIHENESSTDYGENLAEVGSDDKALLRAIDAWYNEMSLYNYQDPKFSTDSGHFSQVITGYAVTHINLKRLSRAVLSFELSYDHGYAVN